MDYLEEIKKLPQEIQDILISPFGTEVNSKIIKKYNLNSEDALMLLNIVNEIYLKSLPLKDLVTKLENLLKKDSVKARELAIDIAGSKLLIANDYFNKEVTDYISSLGSDLNNYQKIVDQERQALKKEKEEFEKDFIKDEMLGEERALKNKPPEIAKEKIDSCNLFNNGLIDIITNQNKEISEIIEDYNDDLIDWLTEDKKFKKNLEDILFSNQEIFTSVEFILDGKPQPPTVDNWIRDFIKSEGSDLFDELALSKYLVNSPNAKKLDEEEKKLLRKLLILYRNLKFFPESLANLPPEEWEIIPLEKEKEELTKARTVGEPVEVEEKKESGVLLPSEYEKEDLMKAPLSKTVEPTKEEPLPDISRLISRAQKEAEEKLAAVEVAGVSAPTPLGPEEVMTQAEQIISQLKISLGEEDKSRLKNILVSFLKGIRDELETREALTKTKDEGGLNFTAEQIEQLFNLIKKQKGRMITKETKGIVAEPVKEVVKSPVMETKKPAAELLELAPPPPAVLETFREKLQEKITTAPSPISQPRLAPTELRGEPSQPSPIIRSEPSEAKPRLEDIKKPSFLGKRPKVELVGPIEEIRNLTLRDLHDFSTEPQKALVKIKEKIELLEQESFLKKIQAIKAWRESEIYQLYLAIGRQIFQEKSSIDQVLERRQSQNLPTLTKAEFSAIMDFNKSLRF